ncbi:MAG TPA: SRPBCC domain-containing protein [Solirubrobacterales bacterium]|nr:SRPBCC domain-containing protein [Solirubrobacterales bacterium]
MKARQLRTETVLDAPPEAVWAVLADFASWDDWNPTLIRTSGPPVVGTEVRMRLRLGRALVPMRQQILEVDPPRRLAWRSRQAWPAALDVHRHFVLEPVEGGRTRFVQYEDTAGFAGPVEVALLGKLIVRGYDDLARALGQRAAGWAA